MAKELQLALHLEPIRKVDERLMSYNVEMTEVTGGTFWKAYTEAHTDTTTVHLPKDAEVYSLSDNGNIRSTVMYLNGNPLTLAGESDLPDLSPVSHPAGSLTLAPATCTFIVL